MELRARCGTAVLQLVSVLLYICIGGGETNREASLYSKIPDLVDYLCPGSNVCSRNKSSMPKDDVAFRPGTESCCAECSCSDDCSKTRNCCFPNKLSSKGVIGEELETFRNDSSCIYPMFPQPTTDDYLYQSLLMVSSIQKKISNVREGTSNVSCGDRQIAPWGSLFPVYSKTSNIIYKNIECAREDNADDDIIIWDAVISCADIEMGMAAIELNANALPESCQINFIFPGDSTVLHPFKCYINVIDTCSGANDFQLPERINVLKDDVRSLCTNSGIVSPYRAEKLYANVFCHICSAEMFYRQSFCKKYDGTKHDFNQKGGFGNFIALIDNIFITTSKDTKKEVFSPLACSPKIVDMCRQIYCPTGQHRDRDNDCVYPSKLWLNQNYAVYVNLTLDTYINVSEVFNFAYGNRKVLPTFESTWLKKWLIDTIFYREMEKPLMSSNLIIILHRKLKSVSPDSIIKSIGKMIGQTWNIDLFNVAKELKSSKFSVYTTTIWNQQHQSNSGSFANLTEYFEVPRYQIAYLQKVSPEPEHIITKLYQCDQVELQSSDFLLSNDMNILYNYMTKRFMCGGEFTLLHNNDFNELRARICIEDSGLFKEDMHNAVNDFTFQKDLQTWFVVGSLLVILQYHVLY